MRRMRFTSGVLIAASLLAIAVAMLLLQLLHAEKERVAVARAEGALSLRATREQGERLETDLRRVLMLAERAREWPTPVRVDIASDEHDLLQQELALLELNPSWSASAPTLRDLRQVLIGIRTSLVAADVVPQAPATAITQPIRTYGGDAPQAVSLMELARGEVTKRQSATVLRLQREHARLTDLAWAGAVAFVLLLGALGAVLHGAVAHPLRRLHKALQQTAGSEQAPASGAAPAAVSGGSSDIVVIAEQACALVAQAEQRSATRVAALREQLAALAARSGALEQARAQSEQAHRDRAQFIAQLGHELRTPLTGMLGLVDLLADEVRSETGQRRLQSIQAAALLLCGVLDRMTDTSGSKLPQAKPADPSPRRAGEGDSLAAAEPPRAASPERQQPGARVLVAEDHAINQVVITEMLEHLGYVVEVVPDGRRAVERVRDELFDVVLMDWSMPQMDGVAAARLIRAEESRTGRPRVKIIALTAHTFAENRQDCLAAGMDDFLAKPITVEALDTAIRRAVA